jgi:hypothetical protein
MRRREFIAGSIAVAAEKSVLPSSAWAQSAPRINRIIDAHCHVFNAADLPIEGFTKKIMVPKSAQTSELVLRGLSGCPRGVSTRDYRSGEACCA